MSILWKLRHGWHTIARIERWRLLGVWVVVVVALLGHPGRTEAATCTWTGLGLDDSTATPANWSGNQVPQGGDDVVFPASAGRYTVTQSLNVKFNSITFATAGVTVYHVSGTITIIDHIQVTSGQTDLTADVVLFSMGNPASVTLSAGAGSELVMLGKFLGPAEVTVHTAGPGRVTLAGPGSYLGSTQVDSGTLRLSAVDALGPGASAAAFIATNATLELAVPLGIIDKSILFNAGATLLASESGTLSGRIDLTGVCSFNVPALSKTLTFTGRIGNIGTFTKEGDGIVRFAAPLDNTFGSNFGAVTVNAGVLRLAQAAGSVSHVALPSGVTIGSAGLPDAVIYEVDNQINGPVTVNSGGVFLLQGHTDAIAFLQGAAGGSVVMNGGSLTVSHGQFGGVISGTGALTLLNGTTVVLTGANTFSGTTTVDHTVLVLNSTGSLPGPLVLSGGTLGGIGTVGPVQGAGQIIPGGLGSTVLHTQSLALTSGTYVVSAVQNPGGPAWTKIAVTGTVTLGDGTSSGPTLGASFDSSITTVPAAPIVIIDNDGTDPVVGTFTGLPEGSSFVSHGLTYYISYHGGDGNDVVLTAIASRTPPPPTLTYYLSEGSTGGFFTTDVLIANPNTTDAPITLTFYTQNKGIVTKDLLVPAMQRQTVTLNTLPEIGDGEVSTIVTSTSGLPLIVERTMTWDKSGYGSHGDKAVSAPASTWYFAEGSQGFFSTYLLFANPQTAANTASVTYYREGDVPITRTYALAAQSRRTIDLGADAALVNRSFGMQVQFDLPGVAERSMYFGTTPFWRGGHESAGVTQPSTTWLLAEGATGPFFETFILLANPNAADAQATVTFLPAGGTPVTKTKTVPAHGRLTINIEPEDPALVNSAVATQVQSTLPIVAERSQYWPDPAPQWYEAHNSFGVTAPGLKWGLSEGRVGQAQAFQTYILLANPGVTAANVTIQFLREHGGAPITKTFVAPATGRLNVSIGGPGSDVPELVDENFGAIITSDQPIAAERSMYSNANGQIWAAGTNATGSPLP